MRIRYLHKTDLIFDERYPASGPKGCLRIKSTGRIVDVAALRTDPDSRIYSDDPQTVCKILGLSFPDDQVVEQ